LIEVSSKLDEWKLAFKGKRSSINRSKTEYVEYAFGERNLEVNGTRGVTTIVSGEVIGEIASF